MVLKALLAGGDLVVGPHGLYRVSRTGEPRHLTDSSVQRYINEHVNFTLRGQRVKPPPLAEAVRFATFAYAARFANKEE